MTRMYGSTRSRPRLPGLLAACSGIDAMRSFVSCRGPVPAAHTQRLPRVVSRRVVSCRFVGRLVGGERGKQGLDGPPMVKESKRTPHEQNNAVPT